jgi:hypothetical protein
MFQEQKPGISAGCRSFGLVITVTAVAFAVVQVFSLIFGGSGGGS